MQAMYHIGRELRAFKKERKRQYRELFSCVEKGDLLGIKAFLVAERALDYKNDSDYIPYLHNAAENGHLAVVKALLAAEADPEQLDYFEQTPLYSAAEFGQEEVVETLLHAKAAPEIVDRASEKARRKFPWACKEWEPLHLAAQKGLAKMMQALVQAGANPNKRDFWGLTPLHYAARSGSTDCVRILLQAGANALARTNNKEIPRDCATNPAKGWAPYPEIIALVDLYDSRKQALAFCMANHPRLGADSSAKVLIPDLRKRIWGYLYPLVPN